MTTPRPHARTRRAAAMLALAGAGLITLGGCDPRTMLYFLQPWEPTVAHPGPSLEGKRVVVLTHAVVGQADFQSLDHDLTREVVRNLRKGTKKIDVVEPTKVWDWVDGHPNWTDPGEAAAAFEADVAIFLEVESFQIANPGSPGLLEGSAKTHIQAIERAYPKNSKGKALTDQPKESTTIYDSYRDSVFPINGPVEEGAGFSRSSFKNKFLSIVAAEISWHFIDHSPEDDIYDSKPKVR
jgi:hypothetical protein